MRAHGVEVPPPAFDDDLRFGDAAMLKGVKAGDKIKFDADRVNGQITVTKLQKSK